MTVIFLLIPLSVAIATGFLIAFIWAVRSGQYEDTTTPSLRVLLNDSPKRSKSRGSKPAAEAGQELIDRNPRPSLSRERGTSPRSS
jgi:cbb3-type cytochrome oxidase maturation protein